MGRYTVHTAMGPKRRVVYGRTRKEAHEKLSRPSQTETEDSSPRARTKSSRRS
jgi:hypothetical protein